MKIKKLLTVFVGVVLTLSLTGCGFSIGTSGESGDYSDVFTDPITSGKIHTMKSYQFTVGDYGSTTVYVDTTDGASFELVETPAGFKINSKSGDCVLDATCVDKDYFKDYTVSCGESTYVYNDTEYLKRPDNDYYCTYLANVGLDCGVIIETAAAKDLSLIAFSGKPLADSSSDVDEYRGVSDEPTSHAEIVTEQSSTEDSTTIEPDTNSADDTTSSDYSTYGEVIDSDTAEKLSSLGTNYSMVKWDHEFYVEGSDHTLVASTAITPDGIVVAITNLGSKSVSFTGSAHIKGDTNSLSDSIALLEPCLAVGGTTINYTECDSANITSITLEDCSITDAYLTAADWSVNATVTTDGTSSSDYGDNVSINYSYESSTGCSYTSLKVLLLNNVGEVLGYGIGFVNDVPVGENVNSTMYAIAAPHSLDSLADMAMFSCPTLE